MEPMDVEKPIHSVPVSKPIIPTTDLKKDVPLSPTVENGKRLKSENGSDDDGKPLSKKHKKSALPPIKKRKTAIESSDDDDGEDSAGEQAAERLAENAHQIYSTAVKVEPIPSQGKEPSSRKTSAGSSDLSDDDVPLARSSKHFSVTPAPEDISINGGDDRESSDEDDKPLAKLPSLKRKKKPTVAVDSADEEEVDVKPLKDKLPALKKKVSKRATKEDEGSETGETDENDATKKKAVAKKVKPRKSKKDTSEEEDYGSEDEKPLKKSKKKTIVKDEPVSKKTATATKKKESTPVAKKGKGRKKEENGDDEVKEEEEEEEVYKWWENQNQDSSVKWTTLQHNGVLFPPPYEPLPSNVKMLYNKKPVDLPPDSEEVATFFAKVIGTQHEEDTMFRNNFFRDFQKILKKFPPRDGTQIESLDKCDFSQMVTFFDAEKERTKSTPYAVKKELRKQKDADEAPYQYCQLDGRKEKIGNFRVEPPGLFRGRGEHPRKGTHKFRLAPEDITLNMSKDAPIPVPNIPGQWKKVINDPSVTWLATWTENVNGQTKYVFLAANSSLKGQSDMAKFEKARKLKDHIARIRTDYTEALRSKVTQDRQRATAMYFIDILALRAGNEKGEDEADTVGCCSLRYEHVLLTPPRTLEFDFLGKDSIRYRNVVEVDEQVFKNIKLFKRPPKGEGDLLFDRLDTTGLNKHLGNYMPGLSAKVFRTYNASHTMEKQLDELTPADGSVADKLLAYNRANRMVAVLCNHQRTKPKGHEESVKRLQEKVLALKYQRLKLRHQAWGLDPKFKKKGVFATAESDLEDDWIKSHEESQKEIEIERARKRFEKTNEVKREANDEEEDVKSLAKTIEGIKEKWEAIKKQTKRGEGEPKKGWDEEKAREALKKMDDRIEAAKTSIIDRDEGAEVALGTSKINYIDPRVTISWAKKHDVPVTKVLSKVLIDKFQWAQGAEPSWRF
ncbi:topoisomerase i [Phaffia rhodozyma]|uniref:DNA topoisomerase I n=1 Tax=Phaffia rhodozyma TaxID=264483 RepID=A0A0F7SHA4_PHARH|nr:topoisomerase i [Phaffia rhodozyma]